MDYLEIEHETPYGCISTSWKRDDEGNILYEFDLPECVSAMFTPLGDNVTYNGDTWKEGDNYTYDAATGTFATIAGQIAVPAATYTQETDGTYTVTPGTTTVTVTGTV